MTASPLNDTLTPLDVSQAVLEGEENPNVARPLTPKEQAARGVAPGRRAGLHSTLRNPALAWGVAGAAGLALALSYARRNKRF